MAEFCDVVCTLFFLCFPLGFLAFICYEAYVFIPTIAHHYNYVPAPLTIRQIDLLPRHCCHLDCFCAEVDDPKAETCAAMQSRSEALSPLLCSAAPPENATSLCPPTGSSAVCNSGPFCCTSCNYTCSSTPINQSGCKCPCSGCGGCSCCKHIEGRLCRLFCNPCFSVNMTVAFDDRHGVARMANISYSSGTDQADAEDFYSAHVANSTFLGFYKPSDPTIVHMSRGYRVRKWVAFIFLSALPFFLIALLITGSITACVLQAWQGHVSKKAVFWVNWVLWVGIIWPFLILLLILELSYPTPRAKTALRVLIPLMACIGWAPILLLWILN